MAIDWCNKPVTLAFARRHYYLFDPVTEEPLENVNMTDIFEAHECVDWESGCTEPWIVDVVCALLIANRAERAIEIGGFTGFASKRLARALNSLRRGHLTVCEIVPERAEYIQTALDILRLPYVQHTVIADDSLRWLPTLPDESIDFAWVDGNHEKEHQEGE